MTVCDTSYHGDTPTCITEYDYAKGQKKAKLGIRVSSSAASKQKQKLVQRQTEN